MATFRKIINDLDGTDELVAAQKEAVKALATLASFKAENMLLEIEESLISAGQSTNLTIPVSAKVKQLYQTRAYSATESNNIESIVKSSMNKFLSGSDDLVVEGIVSLITDSLSLFLGESSADTGEIQSYYIAVEGLSVVRVDVYGWYQTVQASSIYKKMEKVTAIVAVKSVVNLSKVDYSTFIYIYQKQLEKTGMNHEALKKAMKDIKDLFYDILDFGQKEIKLGINKI